MALCILSLSAILIQHHYAPGRQRIQSPLLTIEFINVRIPDYPISLKSVFLPFRFLQIYVLKLSRLFYTIIHPGKCTLNLIVIDFIAMNLLSERYEIQICSLWIFLFRVFLLTQLSVLVCVTCSQIHLAYLYSQRSILLCCRHWFKWNTVHTKAERKQGNTLYKIWLIECLKNNYLTVRYNMIGLNYCTLSLVTYGVLRSYRKVIKI